MSRSRGVRACSHGWAGEWDRVGPAPGGPDTLGAMKVRFLTDSPVKRPTRRTLNGAWDVPRLWEEGNDPRAEKEASIGIRHAIHDKSRHGRPIFRPLQLRHAEVRKSRRAAAICHIQRVSHRLNFAFPPALGPVMIGGTGDRDDRERQQPHSRRRIANNPPRAEAMSQSVSPAS